MNRKATPILLAVVILMSLLAYFVERPSARSAATQQTVAQGATVLSIRKDDILQVRMKRDYWNSFTLARSPDGSWRLVEPSAEPAAEPAVQKLLAALESLPAISVINLSADDSERRREYGLWTPALELTVTTPDGEQVMLVGTATADGKGVYCTRMGQNKVYVTSPDAVRVLSQDLAAYRQEKAPSQP